MSRDFMGLIRANDSMINATTQVQKRQKTQGGNGGAPFFETIAMKLLEQQRELRKSYDDAKLELIEIEVV